MTWGWQPRAWNETAPRANPDDVGNEDIIGAEPPWPPEPPPPPPYVGPTACAQRAGHSWRSVGTVCGRCGHGGCRALMPCDACVLQAQIDELRERT